ncbi:ABC transporter ATP-binding protein [Gemmatimonas aurantiaca]|nr:ABC transporter ATP-binding protein [Gemmatimonas aurantiaca]
MIRFSNIQKSFGKLHVLKNIDLVAPAGKVTAIVGPNGSGKSTIIKLLLGLVSSDSGELFIDNRKLNGDCEYRRHIGYMPQIARFPENLTGAEALNMLRQLRSGFNSNQSVNVPFDLGPELFKKTRTLSGGTRQKLNACVAFMFDPKILALDEPTAGLDPISSGELKELIRYERDCGKTIILTSHIMNELEELADNIIFLLEGRIEFSGSMESLLQETSADRLERALAELMRRRSTRRLEGN